MEAVAKLWNSQRLEVFGRFYIFLLDAEGTTNRSSYIEEEVRQADRSHPWVSEGSEEHRPRITYYIRKGGKIEFELHPQFSILPRQMYAFNRYLRDVAEHLAKNNHADFAQVSVVMEVRTELSTFRTPAGEEIRRRAEEAVGQTISKLGK